MDYVLQVYGKDHYRVKWNKEELQAVSSLSFLLRMLASLELFRLYKEEEGQTIFVETARPNDNPAVIQIFPTSIPVESYFRRYPEGSEEDFLIRVGKGTNPGIQSMDLGEEYRKNFRLPAALISWGYPSPVPDPPWNGMSLLIHTDQKGVEALEDVILALGEDPKDHIRLFNL